MTAKRIGWLAATMLFWAGSAAAFPVGERHLIAHSETAALRDADHRSDVRITVWYPAAAEAKEEALDIGPPGKPLFTPGKAAPDAAFVDARRRPVVLLSHGFGGTARVMAWFGTALARDGYVVIAVDHPGNNGRDKMTPQGAVMFWERPGDLADALRAVEADPAIAPHLDPKRLGASGFSAGGFTALVSAGAKVNLEQFSDFCRTHPQDGVCRPQKEFPLTRDEAMRTLEAPVLAAEVARADGGHAVPGVKAAFAIAPAIVQALDASSLSAMTTPVAIILGEADPVAPPATNGLLAAKAIPHAELKVLPGVGHYDFLAPCTPAGEQAIEICRTAAPKAPSHKAAIEMALAFFHRTLGAP